MQIAGIKKKGKIFMYWSSKADKYIYLCVRFNGWFSLDTYQALSKVPT